MIGLIFESSPASETSNMTMLTGIRLIRYRPFTSITTALTTKDVFGFGKGGCLGVWVLGFGGLLSIDW